MYHPESKSWIPFLNIIFDVLPPTTLLNENWSRHIPIGETHGLRNEKQSLSAIQPNLNSKHSKTRIQANEIEE